MNDKQKEADKPELDELDKDKYFFKAYHTVFFNNLDYQKSPYNFAKELWRLCLEHAKTLKVSLPERKEANKEWGHEHEESSVGGWNACLDAIKLIPQEKSAPDAAWEGPIRHFASVNPYSLLGHELGNPGLHRKYRVEFYEITDKEIKEKPEDSSE